MNILAIGRGADELAQELYPDAKVFHARSRTDKLGSYDIVLALNTLQLHAYRHVKTMLKEWYSHVEAGGRIHVFTPSLEWAAEEVLKPVPSPAALVFLFGVDGENKCQLTMRDLRMHFEAAGIPVLFATTSQYVLDVGGNSYTTEQLYLCGYKDKQ